MNVHSPMQHNKPNGMGEEKGEHLFAHHFMSWFSGVSAAISLSPFLLNALDVGDIKEVQRTLDHNGACCNIIAIKKPGWSNNYSFSSIPKGSVFHGLDGAHTEISGSSYGIAGYLSSVLMRIPKVGYHLGTGTLPEPLNDMLRSIPKMGDTLVNLKLANALAAGGIILLGEVSGKAIDNLEHRASENSTDSSEKKPFIGKAVAASSKGLALFIALPTVLAGVGHAVQTVTATFGIDSISDIGNPQGIGGHIMAFLGKPMGGCGGPYKTSSGGVTAGLFGLCCAVPAAMSVVSALSPSFFKESPTMPSDMPQKVPVSVLGSDIETLVHYHHSIDWETFKQDSAKLDAQVEELQQEVAQKETIARVAKWGTVALGTFGAFTGAYYLMRRGKKPVSETQEAKVVEAAQEALQHYDTVANAKGAPMLPVSKPLAEGVHYPIIPEPGSEVTAQKFVDAFGRDAEGTLKPMPQKIKMKRIDKTMANADGLAPCCKVPEIDCCGTPYYIKEIPEKLSAALKGMLNLQGGQAVDPAISANRQLALGAGMTAVTAGITWFGGIIEKEIVGERKTRLQALLERKSVVDGLKGHWERDMMSPDGEPMQHTR